jgi:hypothetical protein
MYGGRSDVNEVCLRMDGGAGVGSRCLRTLSQVNSSLHLPIIFEEKLTF